jgi:hypothetical protein
MVAPCTIDGLWDTAGGLVDAFTPKACADYLTACGYDGTDRIPDRF